MIVAILKVLMKITTKVFFRKIKTRNIESVPNKGPLMILANHPSAFLDPIIIATLLDRKVYFLAKGVLFKSNFAKWMLPKLNMIPVHRKQDDPNLMNQNEVTFNKCFENLEQGGAILMFPEGISITERKLRPIKTGAARIVLGAEARNDFNLKVNIICVGLNFENPHKFNKSVYVNFDNPIPLSNYKEQYEKDEFATVNELTELITHRLESLMISMQDKNADDLSNKVERLYKSKLKKDLGIDKDNTDEDFMLTKSITNSVNYFTKQSPEYVESMRMRINNYFNNIGRLGLEDDLLLNDKKEKSIIIKTIKGILTMIIGFSLYLYGLINNYLPFEIPGIIAEKAIKQLEFKGPVAMVTGTFTFLIFYSLQIFLFHHYSHSALLTLLYFISLPVSGAFCYWYYHRVKDILSRWYFIRIFFRKSTLISRLIHERDELLKEFEKSRQEYLRTLSFES